MMARFRGRSAPKDSSRRGLWIYIAVIVFLVVDAVLIAFALGTGHSGVSGRSPHPIPTFSVTNPSPSPDPSASARSSTTAISPTRLIAALDATTAWRATTGSCPASVASPQLTTDSGATWKTTDVTGRTKVTALQRIIVTGKGTASMVGLSQSGCTPQLVKTFVGGDNYATYPKDLPGTWFVDLAEPTTVHSPSGDFPAPCPVIALAPKDARSAAVLCTDRTTHATVDAAATWASSAPVPGAVNLAASESGYIAAVVGDGDCEGVRILALTTSLQPGQTGCYPLAGAPADGSVALSEAGGTLWLWAADAVARSSDGGTSWG